MKTIRQKLSTSLAGTYRRAAEITLQILRDNRDSLMSVLETFVHDPLMEWSQQQSRKSVRIISMRAARRPADIAALYPSTVNLKRRDISEDSPSIAAEVARKQLDPVLAKLKGLQVTHDPRSRGEVEVSVGEQVERLIREARNNNNLAVMYVGWCPWYVPVAMRIAACSCPAALVLTLAVAQVLRGTAACPSCRKAHHIGYASHARRRKSVALLRADAHPLLRMLLWCKFDAPRCYLRRECGRTGQRRSSLAGRTTLRRSRRFREGREAQRTRAKPSLCVCLPPLTALATPLSRTNGQPGSPLLAMSTSHASAPPGAA